MAPEPPDLLAILDDPTKALSMWSATLAKARLADDKAAIHASLDVLVHLLLDAGDVDLAEQYARELLEIDEDATHVMLMGKVCKARGGLEEAEAHFQRAATLTENHLDARTRAFMEQAGITVVGRPKE